MAAEIIAIHPSSSTEESVRATQSKATMLVSSPDGNDEQSNIPHRGPLHEKSKEQIELRSNSGSSASKASTSGKHSQTSSTEDSGNEDTRQSAASSMEYFTSYFIDQTACPRIRPALMTDAEISSQTDEDDSSVRPHFAKSDFLRSNWSDAREYIPPIGFAVVVGGLCAMNPIVFVGGALTACTAVGAAHAAQTTYDACVEGNLCSLLSPSQKSDAKQQASAVVTTLSDKVLDEEEQMMRKDVSEVTFETVDAPDSPTCSHHVLSECASESVRTAQHNFSAFQSTEEAMRWVDMVYPRLKYQNVKNLKFVGLNAQEFFHVFLADEAPYTFSEFQQKRQDKKIHYGTWEELVGVTQMSLVDTAAQTSAVNNKLNPSYHFRERVLKFHAKTNNGLLGPPYANTTKVQRCLVASKKLLVLEGKTTVKEIPFCDRFYVLERWVVVTEKQGDQYVSTLDISCEVVFTKSCPFEGMITPKSQDTITEIADQWYDMAQAALKRTEDARLLRLQQENEEQLLHQQQRQQESEEECNDTRQDHDSSSCVNLESEMDESIELERASRGRTRVIGEKAEERNIAEVEFEDGKEKFPTNGPRRRASSIGRSLGRSFSNLMKRNQRSSPDLKSLE